MIQFNQHRLEWLNKADKQQCCVQHWYQQPDCELDYDMVTTHHQSAAWVRSSSHLHLLPSYQISHGSSFLPAIHIYTSYPISISWGGGSMSHHEICQKRSISHQLYVYCVLFLFEFLISCNLVIISVATNCQSWH